VAYNGVKVSLYYEARPNDAVVYANGTDLTAQRYRLRSAVVTVDPNGLAGGGTATRGLR
jgi:hypothetical protein